MAWTLLITVSCLVSADTFRSVDTFNFEYKDKVLHAIFYFVFTVFWFQFFKNTRYSQNLKLKVFVFAVAYGIMIEICQGVFTTERSADFFDVVANTTGSALAILVLWLSGRKK